MDVNNTVAVWDIPVLVETVLSGSLQNLSLILSDWQMDKLEAMGKSEMGIRCLLNAWLISQPKLTQGSYCNATWDDIYCWPPTPVGTVAKRTCSDAFAETQPKYAPHLEGFGSRVCLDNGTWLWGDWTNYSDCADSYEEHIRTTEEEKELVTTVQKILFFGSILSILCLISSVVIFYYFKSLWCDRITIHIHLMVALTLRYALLIVITEPFVLDRATNYRSMDILCKAVLILYLYATVASINWMFIQGMYINGKLTTNVFDGRTPFKVYYVIGWIFPIFLVLIYAVVMEIRHPIKCWKGYSDMDEMWIILGPILFALIVNFLFLINILRILVTKGHTGSTSGNSGSSDSIQFRRAAKATVFLLPLLGVNNLLFVYNPGGNLHKYYVIFNSLFGSTQGFFVSVVYCYLSKDVRDAFRRLYRRYKARQYANRIRRRSYSQRGNRGSTSASRGPSAVLIVEQPISQSRASTQLLRPHPPQRNLNSVSPCLSSNASSPNTLVRDVKTFLGNDSPSSNYSLSSACSNTQRVVNGLNNNISNDGSELVQSSFVRSAVYSSSCAQYHRRTTDVVMEARPISKNHYTVVAIPLGDISAS